MYMQYNNSTFVHVYTVCKCSACRVNSVHVHVHVCDMHQWCLSVPKILQSHLVSNSQSHINCRVIFAPPITHVHQMYTIYSP